MWSSDLGDIYCIVLQGKLQPSGTAGKFKQMLRCCVFATVICPCSAATHHSTLFFLHYHKKRASCYTSDAQSAVELHFLCLKDRQTASLLEHHTHHHTLQQWQMYSGIIIQRNCSYLCFKGSSSNTPHPPPASCCYCCCCCCSCCVCCCCSGSVLVFLSQLAPAPLHSSCVTDLISSC